MTELGVLEPLDMLGSPTIGTNVPAPPNRLRNNLASALIGVLSAVGYLGQSTIKEAANLPSRLIDVGRIHIAAPMYADTTDALVWPSSLAI